MGEVKMLMPQKVPVSVLCWKYHYAFNYLLLILYKNKLYKRKLGILFCINNKEIPNKKCFHTKFKLFKVQLYICVYICLSPY